MRITAAIIGLTGFALLWLVDWHIAVGVFLVLYGNNLQVEDHQRRKAKQKGQAA